MKMSFYAPESPPLSGGGVHVIASLPLRQRVPAFGPSSSARLIRTASSIRLSVRVVLSICVVPSFYVRRVRPLLHVEPGARAGCVEWQGERRTAGPMRVRWSTAAPTPSVRTFATWAGVRQPGAVGV